MSPKLFILFFTTTLFLTSLSQTPEYITNSNLRDTPLNPRVPKTYDIDLGQNYTEQWTAILADLGDDVLAFMYGMATTDPGTSMGLVGNGEVPSWALDLLNYTILASYNKNWADEILAIAGLLNLEFNEVALLNFMYDLTAQCTSVVVQDDDDNVFHARNLDFPYAPFLANITFHGRYFRDGDLVYEAIGLAGYTGLLTGLKNNSFSLSINQFLLTRNATLWDNIEILALDVAQVARGYLTPPLVARQAFENFTDYDDLVEFLTSTNVVSNVFYIVAGTQPGQGEVITRFRNSVENTTTLDAGDDRWFVSVTNYAGNETDPWFDNRQTAVINFLNDVGRDDITHETLLDVLMKPIVFNNMTIHTTVMQPSSGYFNTTIWW